MNKKAFHVVAAMVGAVILFSLLRVNSSGFFRGSTGEKTPQSIEGKNLDQASFEQSGGKTTKHSKTNEFGAADSNADLAMTVSRLNEQNRALRAQNDKIQNRLVAVLNWILANFRGKYPLSETYMSKLQITPLTEDYTLHPEVLNFLKITAEEEQKVNDALAYAYETLQEIEATLLTVSNPRPDKVILHIPAFAENGKILQADLYAALDATLGPDRFDRFLQVSETGLKQSFYHFGEASRTMVFELAYTSNSTLPQLKIKDGWVIELGPNLRQVTAVESYVTNLPTQYNMYLAWLPNYVGEYASPKQP